MCSIDFLRKYNIQTFGATLGVHSVSIALGKTSKAKRTACAAPSALRGYSWLWLLYWLWTQYSGSLCRRLRRPLKFKLPNTLVQAINSKTARILQWPLRPILNHPLVLPKRSRGYYPEDSSGHSCSIQKVKKNNNITMVFTTHHERPVSMKPGRSLMACGKYHGNENAAFPEAPTWRGVG